MVMLPGATIPFHLGWVGFAIAFGFGTWSRWQLITSVTWYSLATGTVLVLGWHQGHLGWEEPAELPLMCLLAVLIAWLVRRSRTAQAQLATMAEQNVQASRDRERLIQLTSHELRTPLTIARGYIEVMQTRNLEDPQDLSVVADELDRLSQVSNRLIRMMKLQEDKAMEIVDIDQVVAQSVERWRVVADRRWVVEGHAGRGLGSAERLRTCLDTLIENAIRYTSVGGTIRLVESCQGQHAIVTVFDSGVGLSDRQIMAINNGESSALTATTAFTDPVPDRDTNPVPATDTDPRAGTGLGLSIVRRAVHARGGTLHASHAPEGGAALTIIYPLQPPGQIGRFSR